MPKKEIYGLLTALGISAHVVNGQLEPDCNPLTTDCPAKRAWPHDNYYIDFTKQIGPPDDWIIANNEVIDFTPKGAEFTYGKRGDAPNLWTDFYMLGGRYDVEMQIAPGQGVISSAVLWSDIQDEIDWEFSGNQHGEQPLPPPDGMWTVETNIFAQGKMWDGAATYQKDSHNPTTEFHTYSVDWDENHMNWYVDNKVVRSVQATDTPAGFTFPQSPMKLQLGLWGGGDPDNNYWTIQWAGGNIDLSGTPYTMYIKSVNITNKYPACQYKYKDRSGKIDSIDKIQDGCSSSETSSPLKTARIVKNDYPAASYPVSSADETPATSNIASSESSAGGYPTSAGYPTSEQSVTSSSISSASSIQAEPSSYPSSDSPTESLSVTQSSAAAVSSSAVSSIESPSSGSSSAADGYSTSGGYPIGSYTFSGGLLSSISSYILGTSSGAATSATATFGSSSLAASSSGGYPTSSGSASGAATSSYGYSVSSGALSVSPSSYVPGYLASSGALSGSATASPGYPTSSAPFPGHPQSSRAFSGSASSSIGVTGSSSAAAVSGSATPSTNDNSDAVVAIGPSTVSTVYSTNVYTVTSCAPTVTDCPARLGKVTTELISVSTTICPVTQTEKSQLPGSSSVALLSSVFASSISSGLSVSSMLSSSAYPSSSFGSVLPSQNATSQNLAASETLPSTYSVSSQITTSTMSTVYSTNVYTVTSCASTVTNCPAKLGQVTTEMVSLYTTVCPVTHTVLDGKTFGGMINAVPITTSVPGSSYAATSAISVGTLSSNLASNVIPQNGTMLPSGSISIIPTMQVSSSSVAAVSTPARATTSVVYSTNVYTVTSCAPTVNDCPAKLGQVTTELVPSYTTIRPVQEIETASESSSVAPVSTATSSVPLYSSVVEAQNTSLSSAPPMTTSTVYTSSVYSTMGSITTEMVALYTTVCPVKEQSSAAPEAPVSSVPAIVSQYPTSSTLAESSTAPVSSSMPVYSSMPAYKNNSQALPSYTTSTVYSTNIYTGYVLRG
ncbi:hypothetical protein F5Y15DRAFT_103745 [Xylariaceae sp. FL0016]|nr:hypothetical protein F5Y15DRAFT_103745 [Xylariaceae sp. FL0016]